jgi:lauroyl/myristoyl acyltransferase
VARALARVGQVLRLFDRRIPLVEAMLGARLSEAEADAIARACRTSRMRFGAYYSWRLRRLAIARTLARAPRDQVLACIARHDASCYAPLDIALEDPRGLVLAIPHHGPFLPAIVALCEHLRATREVFVLLEPEAAGATHAPVDALHRNLQSTNAGRTGPILLHDGREGLRRAVRELRRGSVVVVMPDAYRAVEATYQLAFCGGQRNVMLGTAALARRADARVLPLVAMPRGGIFGFASAFGPVLLPRRGDGSREAALHADYRLTVAMFRAYEPLMARALPYWQYCTGHAADAAFVAGLAPEDTVDIVGPLLLEDPRICLREDVPIRLDGVAGLSAA